MCNFTLSWRLQARSKKASTRRCFNFRCSEGAPIRASRLCLLLRIVRLAGRDSPLLVVVDTVFVSMRSVILIWSIDSPSFNYDSTRRSAMPHGTYHPHKTTPTHPPSGGDPVTRRPPLPPPAVLPSTRSSPTPICGEPCTHGERLSPPPPTRVGACDCHLRSVIASGPPPVSPPGTQSRRRKRLTAWGTPKMSRLRESRRDRRPTRPVEGEVERG